MHLRHDVVHFLPSNTRKRTARRYSPSLLVRARGGDELAVGRFLETLSRGCGCGPSRFGLGLNSVLKSTRSKPSSNSCISSNSSGSISPSYCSLNTDLGTGTEKESSESARCVMDSISDTSNIHRRRNAIPYKIADIRKGSGTNDDDDDDDEHRDKIISASVLISAKSSGLLKFE